MIQRRAFMKSGAVALFAAGFQGGIPGFLLRAAGAPISTTQSGKKKILGIKRRPEHLLNSINIQATWIMLGKTDQKVGF